MVKQLVVFISAMFLITSLQGQSFVFGPKIGPGINFQFWNGLERQALLAPHFDLFIESYTEGSNSALFAQIGYHTRGSSERRNLISGPNVVLTTPSYRFNNASLVLGVKRNLTTVGGFNSYYTFGLRGEYTLSTNLDRYENISLYYPSDGYVNKFNYGVSISGGFEKNFSELVGAALEFTLSPDLSRQYFQPPIPNIANPWGSGNLNLREQEIRNLSFEVSLVLRLLRKVEFI